MGNFVSNDNATTLFGDVGKKKVGWDAAASSVKKNKLKVNISDLKANNTTGTWTGNTYAVNGVSFAVTTDNRGYVLDISASTGSGGATGNAYLNIYGISIESGDIINGCPSGGSGTTYSQVVCSNNGQTVYATDIGSGAEINTTDSNGRCIVRVLSGAVITTPISFKPMIRPASITNADYAPWIPDNAELDEKISSLVTASFSVAVTLTVNANFAATIDITKAGYKPLAIAQFAVSPRADVNITAVDLFASTNKAQIAGRSGVAGDFTASITVLFIKE